MLFAADHCHGFDCFGAVVVFVVAPGFAPEVVPDVAATAELDSPSFTSAEHHPFAYGVTHQSPDSA